jgi:MFS family permease
MASTSTATAIDRHAAYNKSRLFLISVIALVTAGVSFSMRASIATALRATFFDPINATHSEQMIGSVLGIASLGFAITIAIGSPLCDYLGMGALLMLSSFCFMAGTLIVDFAGQIATGDSIYWVLWGGVALLGVGWGLVEAVINPLITTLYPDDKTAKLNALHAWWPGGCWIN